MTKFVLILTKELILMQCLFKKYQGAGNDFIMIDNRRSLFPANNRPNLIEKLCDRRFGIGADGLILLEEDPNTDFKMVYYNADGNESSMCGNGGRCIVAFAKELSIIENHAIFSAIDGLHQAIIVSDDRIDLSMNDVRQISIEDHVAVLNTGSPHYVSFVHSLKDINVYETGKKIRNSDPYQKEGINVNFVEESNGTLNINTYERGVENETLACGTGVTAAVLAWNEIYNKRSAGEVQVNAKGGKLSVRFVKDEAGYHDIWLCGPTQKVFEGQIEL